MPILSFCLTDTLCGDTEKIISSLPFGPEERSRLSAIKSDSARAQSLGALSALADTVDTSLDCTVCRTKCRKPYFKALPFHFSLSHIPSLSVAVLSDEPVGIDAEWLEQNRNTQGISARFFTSEEQEEILSSDDSTFAFFSLWTKKEAFAKLTGEGLISVCSESVPADAVFTQYALELSGRRGIISVCHNKKEEISILNPYKELKLYELQN